MSEKRAKKQNNFLINVIIVCAVVLTMLVIGALFVPRVNIEASLNGDKTMIVEYGTEFTDPGANAVKDGQALVVEAEGTVDVNKLGEYTITYYAQANRRVEVETRTVKVVDTTQPVITLHTTPGYVLLPGETYQEEGFTATDNYDGDITDKVQRQEEAERISYTVTDSSGNTVTVYRDLVYGDEIAPVITLEGETEIKLKAGQSYQEPGFKANDNCDGDVTDKVTVSGTVDTTKGGTYTITYTVTDAHGNKAEVTRKVIVEGDSKVIYLTFDDGPGIHTERLLEVLKKYNAKATFFVVNTKHIDLLPKIAADGHAIGVHTLTHKYEEVYASDEAFFKDFDAMRQIIHDKTGIWTTLMRFPGGSSNVISKRYCPGIMTRLTKAVTEKGYQYFDWNADSMDAGGAKTADDVYRNAIKSIGNHKTAVLLQHDIKGFSVDAVERIIIWGQEHGYTFQALTPNSPTCHHGVNN